MIIQEDILISLNSKNFNYYKKLGYDTSIQIPNKILVKIKDLSPQSNVKILCKCDNCGKVRSINFKQYRPICLQCSRKTNEFKNQISKTRKGKIHSTKSKKLMSQNNWMRNKLGKDNPFYNANLTDQERKIQHNILGIHKWKQQVKERDNYTCQKCGSKKHLHVHHINNFRDFKEQRLLIENGITLCFDCHKGQNGIHILFGNLTTKKDLNKFLNS